MSHPISALLNYCIKFDWAMDLSVLERMNGVIERHISGHKLAHDEIIAITNERDSVAQEQKFEIVDGAALIPVTGVIAKHSSMVNGMSQPEGTSVETMRSQLNEALGDDRVGSIFLMIDSPGGSIDGLADFADEVFEASHQKPVVAFADDLCASAAFWIASQANVIFSNQTADIGSIGVYALAVDSSERAKQEGLKFHIFRSGDQKGVGAPGIEITEENRNVIQERIDAKFEIFLDAIMQGRGDRIDRDDLRALADGRCFVGAAALEHNLIDGVTTMSQAFTAALPPIRKHKSVAADASAEKNEDNSFGKESQMAKTESIDASDNAKAAADAVKADRERVAGINEALAGDAFADLRAKAIPNGTSVSDAKAEAFELAQEANAETVKGLQAVNATAQVKLDAIAQGGSDSVAAAATDDSEETTTADKTEGDSDAPAAFVRYRDQLETQGKTQGEAIIAAADRFPNSHDAWVNKQPKSTAK